MDITVEDVKQIQNETLGYDVSHVRDFKKRLEKLCDEFGLLGKDGTKTVTDQILPLIIHEAIQVAKEQKQLLENEKGEYGYV